MIYTITWLILQELGILFGIILVRTKLLVRYHLSEERFSVVEIGAL